MREVVQRLVKARNGPPADFAGLDLSFLDLTGLDFSAANLAGVNMFGSELDHADLSDANLAGAMLDRTVIIGTSFARANMTGVKLRRPAAFTTLEVRDHEAPNFRRRQSHGRGDLRQAERIQLLATPISAARSCASSGRPNC